ncbi:hypothetical protein [Pontibacter sp. G13]|uniref:hypothetical protein n=1 Tax=Pontibacter sp. G13 TaxID=3074898 RepID=UPI00288C4C37|nr:hypothetical protein [Pontibacter sp. G13]WNJ19913.1 hypothetical protein RJD25_05470 [Pontibacter sp. G13]
MATINMGGIVHLQADFRSWEKLFLDHEDNRAQVEAGNYFYAKADSDTVLLILKHVDAEEMRQRMASPAFAKLIEGIVESHEMYVLQPMPTPAGGN